MGSKPHVCLAARPRAKDLALLRAAKHLLSQ